MRAEDRGAGQGPTTTRGPTARWVWVAAGGGLAMVALAPWLASVFGRELWLTYLALPVYMLHQWEEHGGDRFRDYFNRRVGQGREVLTRRALWWTNVVGVWGGLLAQFIAAWAGNPAAGLVGAYLMLVNAVLHSAQAAAWREYNPGLGTAWGMFVPLGGATVWAIHAAGKDSEAADGLALGISLAVHGGIAAHARRRAMLGAEAGDEE